MENKGTVYFFTGLSGAGKTTIGSLFYQHLKKKHPNAVLEDGDAMRKALAQAQAQGEDESFSPEMRKLLAGFNMDAHDYTYEGRLKGAWVVFQWCKELAEQGKDVVVCSICMYDAVRQWNRENIPNYREIYIKVSKDTLWKRDQKGLYSSGAKNVVGVDIPAEEPTQPDMIIYNEGDESPEEIVRRIEKKFGLDV